MRKEAKENRVHNFEREFTRLLPQSFEILQLYLKKRLGLVALPVYRSPQNRHVLAVTSHTMTRTLLSEDSAMGKRSHEALKSGHNSRFWAMLGAPFDHIPGNQVFQTHYSVFLQELETLSDEEFQHLQTYIGFSFSRLEAEKFYWWFHTSAEKQLAHILTIATAALFLLQTVIGHVLIPRIQPIAIGSFSINLPTYRLALVLAVGMSMWLLARTRGLSGVFAALATIFFFPLYITWQILLWLLRKTYSVPFESFILKPRDYQQQGVLSSTWLPVALASLNILAAYIAFRFQSFYLEIISLSTMAITLVGLMIWYYHWNFHPLFFFERGIRLNLYLRLMNVELDTKKLEAGKAKPLSFQSSLELDKAYTLCQNLDHVVRTNRLDIFATSSFIIMFIFLFALVIVEYGITYASLNQLGPMFFSQGAHSKSLSDSDMFRLSMNNLPIGGSAAIDAGPFWVELILFSQRFLATLLLVLAFFSYSIFSNLQLETEKQRLRNYIRGQRNRIQKARGFYKQIDEAASEDDTEEVEPDEA